MDDDDDFWFIDDDDVLNADHLDGSHDSDFTFEDDLDAAYMQYWNFDLLSATNDELAEEIDAEYDPLNKFEETWELQEAIFEDTATQGKNAAHTKPSSTVQTNAHQKESGVSINKGKEQYLLGFAEMTVAAAAGLYINGKRIELNKELEAKQLGGEPITFGDRARQGLTLAGCVGACIAFADGACRTFTNTDLGTNLHRLMQMRENAQTMGIAA